ncbi:MAG: hypothetical protein ILO36_02665 [Abditibacteriota bacterium]|nr:hypothetical protein [Abditibacteriota bacterium]
MKAIRILLFAAGLICAACLSGASQFTDEIGKVYKSAKEGCVAGSNGYLFLKSELHFLAQESFWGPAAKNASAAKNENADPLPAIVDFNSQLKKKGIELIVLPVPAKAAVYPELLTSCKTSAASRADAACARFYAQLKSKGVKVIDLAPAYIAAKGKGGLYCKTDSHWQHGGMDIAAKAVQGAVKGEGWYKAAKKTSFAPSSRTIEINGDLRKMMKSPGPKETVKIYSVPGAVSASSPVLLLGDSHTLVFHSGGDMLAVNAGFAEALAGSLKMPVDLLGVKGSGATSVRVNLMRKPEALKGKKLVVWCFAARDFTESSQGWAKVPLK